MHLQGHMPVAVLCVCMLLGRYVSWVQATVTLTPQAHLRGAQLLPRDAVQGHRISSECQLLQSMWEHAALTLGVTLPRGYLCGFVQQFYTQEFDEVHAWRFEQALLHYITNWKCANVAIRCNLDVVPQGSSEYIESIRSFSFVRNPLQHFISGYSEVNFKGEYCDEGGTYRDFAMDSVDRAFTFVKDLVSGQLASGCWVIYHTFSMLGPLKQYNAVRGPVDFVWRLENFDEHWGQLEDLAGTSFPKFDNTCGMHPESNASSGYPPRKAMEDVVSLHRRLSGKFNNSQLVNKSEKGYEKLDTGRQAMRAMLALKPNVTLALNCAILLPDYLCLGYHNPTGAEECVQAGYADSLGNWEELQHAISVMLCPEVVSFGRFKG